MLSARWPVHSLSVTQLDYRGRRFVTQFRHNLPQILRGYVMRRRLSVVSLPVETNSRDISIR